MSRAAVIATSIVGAAVIGLISWMWGPQIFHYTWTFLRAGFLPIIFFTTAAALAIIALVRSDWGDGGAPLFGAGAILSAIGGIWMWSMLGYWSANQTYNASSVTEVQDADSLSFRERAAYDVASATSTSITGNIDGDVTGIVKSLPAQGDHGHYSTSIVKKGVGVGYAAVQTMEIPLYGQATAANVTLTPYSENAQKRLGGAFPWNNLDQAILAKTSPSTSFERSDAIANVENGTPVLYVPLTRLEGFPVPYRVPGGVAVYNGSTGELRIENEASVNGVPLYPLSLAAQQRQSTQARGGFLSYVQNREGFESNSGTNADEIAMASLDDASQDFVSPLKSRGSSRSIIALSTVEASRTLTPGRLNPLTIHRYKTAHQPPSAVMDSIKNSILEGRAPGMEVFEIVPAKDGSWTASVGAQQSISYRGSVNANGEVSLTDRTGRVIGQTNPSATSDGGKDDAASPASGSTTGKPLSGLTDKELAKLLQDASEELNRRTK